MKKREKILCSIWVLQIGLKFCDNLLNLFSKFFVLIKQIFFVDYEEIERSNLEEKLF